MSFLVRWVRSIFTLDLRSLGLFRIGLGLVVVVDVCFRALDVEIFYSDAGVRPRPLDQFLSAPSLYLLNGSVAFAALLLALTAVAGLALALGWRTRLSAVATWGLVLSVQHRNPSITTGADGVLLLLCTFACFLPLAHRFSLDAQAHPERAQRDPAVFATSTVGLLLQLGVIYVFNVVNKTGASWKDGSAVLRSLQIDQHTTPLGALLLAHTPWLSPPLTFGTLIVESSVLLLLVSFARDRIRVVVVVAFWLLHFGLGTTLYLGLFSPVCMVAWLAVLPPLVWQRGPLARLAARAATATSETVRSSAIAVVAVAVAVTLILVVQLWVNVAYTTQSARPEAVAVVGRAFAIDETWKMFGSPGIYDGWFIIPGKLASGRTVDLFQDGAELTEVKPRYVSHMYKTARWRKFMMNNSNEKRGRASRKAYAAWLCRSWNETHSDDDRLTKLSIVFMLEKTRRDLKKPKVKKQELTNYTCRTSAVPSSG